LANCRFFMLKTPNKWQPFGSPLLVHAHSLELGCVSFLERSASSARISGRNTKSSLYVAQRVNSLPLLLDFQRVHKLHRFQRLSSFIVCTLSADC
ncbi:hypothetical protein, partial [Pseudomonas syringae group genomosp. 3]|uniref:hypothetical protein n=1 Tax=Pseudomonas syringae group genomosp. 3 TaxID=251701 RepID=UPI001C83B810